MVGGDAEGSLRGSLGGIYLRLLGVAVTQHHTTRGIKSGGMEALAMWSTVPKRTVETVNEASVCFQGSQSDGGTGTSVPILQRLGQSYCWC